MTLTEIKSAVLAGKTVHWKNEGYRVIHAPKIGEFLIRFDYNESMTGLTWADGVTMNEREEDFFVASKSVTATFRKPDGEIVKDSSYHEPVNEAIEAADEDAHRYGWEFLGAEVGQ